jgi:low affinity Fe/Cu permease
MATTPTPSVNHVLRERFRRFACSTADTMGSPWMFFLAVATVIVWAVSGPMFGYSDSWQLIINTGTTILTFLMVFLIQNTQNRDAKAIHLKLDELIRGVEGARTRLVSLEDMTDDELAELQAQFKRLHDRVTQEGSSGDRAA